MNGINSAIPSDRTPLMTIQRIGFFWESTAISCEYSNNATHKISMNTIVVNTYTIVHARFASGEDGACTLRFAKDVMKATHATNQHGITH